MCLSVEVFCPSSISIPFMLCEALLTYTETPEFLHNYANGPDGSMMSAILFDILTLQSAGVQTHAN